MTLNPIRILRRLIELDKAKADIQQLRRYIKQADEQEVKHMLETAVPNELTVDHLRYLISWLKKEPQHENTIFALALRVKSMEMDGAKIWLNLLVNAPRSEGERKLATLLGLKMHASWMKV